MIDSNKRCFLKWIRSYNNINITHHIFELTILWIDFEKWFSLSLMFLVYKMLIWNPTIPRYLHTSDKSVLCWWGWNGCCCCFVFNWGNGTEGHPFKGRKEERRRGKYMKYAFIFIFAFNFAKIMRADEIRSVTTGREWQMRGKEKIR